MDSTYHNHAFYCVTLDEFLVNSATMAAPIVNKKLRFEDSFKVHNIHTKFKKYICVTIWNGMWDLWRFSGLMNVMVACSFKAACHGAVIRRFHA